MYREAITPDPAATYGLKIDRAWQGATARIVSRYAKDDEYGHVPYSELAMHTGAAGKPIIRYALFYNDRGYPSWAHVLTADGHILDGTPNEVLSPEVKSMLRLDAERV